MKKHTNSLIKFTFIIIITMILTVSAYSDGCIDNQDNEIVVNHNNFDPLWDWTKDICYGLWTEEYSNDIEIDSIGETVLVKSTPLPYFTNEGPAGSYWIDQEDIDINPGSGWNLLYKDFGSKLSRRSFPKFILYNKYRGLLRLFFFYGYSETFSLAAVNIGFREVSAQLSPDLELQKNSTALLTFMAADSLSYLDTYDPNVIQTAICQVAPGTWSYADFFLIGYDPSTAGKKNTFLVFDIQGVVESSLEDVKGMISLNQKSASVGAGDVTDFAKGAYSYAKNTYEGVQWLKQKFSAKKTASPLIEFIFESAKEDSNPLEYFVPSIAGMLGGINALGGGIFGSKTPSPLAFEGTFELGGKIITKKTMPPFTIRLPGSFTGEEKSVTDPLYNSPLGIFNILTQPTVHITRTIDYEPDNAECPSGIGNNWSYYYGADYVRALTPIEYVLNPDAELIVKNIEAAYWTPEDSVIHDNEWIPIEHILNYAATFKKPGRREGRFLFNRCNFSPKFNLKSKPLTHPFLENRMKNVLEELRIRIKATFIRKGEPSGFTPLFIIKDIKPLISADTTFSVDRQKIPSNFVCEIKHNAGYGWRFSWRALLDPDDTSKVRTKIEILNGDNVIDQINVNNKYGTDFAKRGQIDYSFDSWLVSSKKIKVRFKFWLDNSLADIQELEVKPKKVRILADEMEWGPKGKLVGGFWISPRIEYSDSEPLSVEVSALDENGHVLPGKILNTDSWKSQWSTGNSGLRAIQVKAETDYGFDSIVIDVPDQLVPLKFYAEAETRPEDGKQFLHWQADRAYSTGVPPSVNITVLNQDGDIHAGIAKRNAYGSTESISVTPGQLNRFRFDFTFSDGLKASRTFEYISNGIIPKIKHIDNSYLLSWDIYPNDSNTDIAVEAVNENKELIGGIYQGSASIAEIELSLNAGSNNYLRIIVRQSGKETNYYFKAEITSSGLPTISQLD